MVTLCRVPVSIQAWFNRWMDFAIRRTTTLLKHQRSLPHRSSTFVEVICKLIWCKITLPHWSPRHCNAQDSVSPVWRREGRIFLGCGSVSFFFSLIYTGRSSFRLGYVATDENLLHGLAESVDQSRTNSVAIESSSPTEDRMTDFSGGFRRFLQRCNLWNMISIQVDNYPLPAVMRISTSPMSLCLWQLRCDKKSKIIWHRSIDVSSLTDEYWLNSSLCRLQNMEWRRSSTSKRWQRTKLGSILWYDEILNLWFDKFSFALVSEWNTTLDAMRLLPLLSGCQYGHQWHQWFVQHLSRTKCFCCTTERFDGWSRPIMDESESERCTGHFIRSTAESSSLHLFGRVRDKRRKEHDWNFSSYWSSRRRAVRIDYTVLSLSPSVNVNNLTPPPNSAFDQLYGRYVNVRGPDWTKGFIQAYFISVDKSMRYVPVALALSARTTSIQRSDSSKLGKCLASIE